jgi:hypothetical protein
VVRRQTPVLGSGFAARMSARTSSSNEPCVEARNKLLTNGSTFNSGLPGGGGGGGGGDFGGTYDAGGAVAFFHFSGGFSEATGANVRGNLAKSAGDGTWLDTYSSATKKLVPLRPFCESQAACMLSIVDHHACIVMD